MVRGEHKDRTVVQALDEEPEVPHLTQRETQVLMMVAAGSTAKEIAKRLDLSPRTVDKYIDHLRIKTRTRNKSHLVAYALKHGLIVVR